MARSVQVSRRLFLREALVRGRWGGAERAVGRTLGSGGIAVALEGRP